MATSIVPIPGPSQLPFLGNIADIDKDSSIKDFKRLSKEFGEIFQLKLLSDRLLVVSNHALVDEVCNEKRFKKIPNNVIRQLREGVGDGLFTAYLEEPNWGIAHRVLMPAFGPLTMGSMFGEMHDVASQLVLKWARHGPNHKILLTDDFTRLALDTLALCSMGFRFNSYYGENVHPFIDSMGDFLSESGRKTQRPPLPSWFYKDADQKFKHNIDVLRETAETVLKERVADPTNERKDLLAAMLKGRDSQTGEKMTDASIIDNLITFLIAGHETTSGMLSYACHRLLRNPEAYRKVQEEVDRIIGQGPITLQHIQEFKYIPAVLRETLRLDSPIPVISVSPLEDTVIGGKYEVLTTDSILILMSGLHNDPAVYEDPHEFRPERMLDENFNKLPKNAWKPFGSGVRSCIGRPFAWQEAILAMALIFQNFDLFLDDPDYKLEHKQTLTLKPDELYVHTKLRDGSDSTKLLSKISGAESFGAATMSGHHHAKQNGAVAKDGSKMTILYGSNSGTCEALAQSLATNASARGYDVAKLGAMDEAAEDLPRDDPNHPVVIITASYEGQPPDNAVKFVNWIENTEDDDSPLRGVRYAVFGCGNHEWAQTFHRIPNLVDQRLEKLGASRIVDLGLADVAQGDVFSEFETWEDEVFWPSLDTRGVNGSASAPAQLASSLKVTTGGGSVPQPRRNVEETKVLDVKTLTAHGEPVKKHIEIQLPPGATYRAGDYLAIMPSNPKASVLRALRRFNLKWDETMAIEGSSVTLPTGVTMYARAILSDFVELGQPITKKGILQLAEATSSQAHAAELRSLAEDDAYSSNISAKRVSILDLLERYPSINMELGAFLALLPPMRVRQYSIASSPVSSPLAVTITYSVLEEQAKSGQGTYYGVASSYLSSLQTGDPIHVAVRASNAHFHLPAQPEDEPIILIAAGTGIAPFRGFVQERAALINNSQKKLAPAVLYYGCRGAERDDLYADEFAQWEAEGAVTVRRAYSRDADAPYKYVQDALAAHGDELRDLWKKNAKVYVCGSRAISQAVDKVAVQVKKDAAEKKGEHPEEAAIKEWWEKLRNIRYVSDVFD